MLGRLHPQRDNLRTPKSSAFPSHGDQIQGLVILRESEYPLDLIIMEGPHGDGAQAQRCGLAQQVLAGMPGESCLSSRYISR